MREGQAWITVAALFVVGATAPGATARPDRSASKVIPAEQMHFYQNRQGLTVANAWGDPAAGPHSNFIRMPGGARSGLHAHSFSYYGVVVSGTLANEPTDSARPRPLAPGSYWFQKGGEPHVTNCLSRTECLIFVTSKGPFDFLKVAPAATPPRR